MMKLGIVAYCLVSSSAVICSDILSSLSLGVQFSINDINHYNASQWPEAKCEPFNGDWKISIGQKCVMMEAIFGSTKSFNSSAGSLKHASDGWFTKKSISNNYPP